MPPRHWHRAFTRMPTTNGGRISRVWSHCKWLRLWLSMMSMAGFFGKPKCGLGHFYSIIPWPCLLANPSSFASCLILWIDPCSCIVKEPHMNATFVISLSIFILKVSTFRSCTRKPTFTRSSATEWPNNIHADQCFPSFGKHFKHHRPARVFPIHIMTFKWSEPPKRQCQKR